MKSASGAQISPDGRYVAYVVTQTNWEENDFTQQIWIVQTATGRLRGVLFQDPDIRLKDNLNDRSEDFIALEDVEILSADGAVLDRCPFMTINKRHIAWVMPDPHASVE